MRVRTNTKHNGMNEDVLRKEQASIAAKEAMHDASKPPYTLKLSPNNELLKQPDSASRDEHEVIFTISCQQFPSTYISHREWGTTQYFAAKHFESQIRTNCSIVEEAVIQ